MLYYEVTYKHIFVLLNEFYRCIAMTAQIAQDSCVSVLPAKLSDSIHRCCVHTIKHPLSFRNDVYTRNLWNNVHIMT